MHQIFNVSINGNQSRLSSPAILSFHFALSLARTCCVLFLTELVWVFTGNHLNGLRCIVGRARRRSQVSTTSPDFATRLSIGAAPQMASQLAALQRRKSSPPTPGRLPRVVCLKAKTSKMSHLTVKWFPRRRLNGILSIGAAARQRCEECCFIALAEEDRLSGREPS